MSATAVVTTTPERRGTIKGLLALLFWSITVALARSLAGSIGPLTAAAAVYSLSGVLCIGYFLMRPVEVKRILRMSLWYLIGCGLLFFAYTVVLFLAIAIATDAGQVLEIGLVNYLWPALTMVLSLPLLGRRASLWLLPATAIALLGIFVVLTEGAEVSWRSFAGNIASNPWAYLLGLVAAISWALYSNLVDRWGGAAKNDRESNGPLLFIPVTGLAMLAAWLLSNEESTWTSRACIEVVIMALSTVLGYVFWDSAMRNSNRTLVKACAYLLPFLSTLITCAYFRIMPGFNLWLGCGLLVVGSVSSWRSVE